MPKPKSLGFPYFSQDTDTFQDVKIRLLISQHGCAGYTVWEYLKQAAYRENGYYVEWNDERKELAAADLYLSVENIGLIVSYLLKRSLLVSKSFNGVTVLTSHGIQKRFQEMAKSAKRDYYNFLPEVWLLSDEETYHSVFCTHCSDNSGIKGDNSGIKGDNSGIIPQKKRKEKESKVNNNITHTARSAREGEDSVSSEGSKSEEATTVSQPVNDEDLLTDEDWEEINAAPLAFRDKVKEIHIMSRRADIREQELNSEENKKKEFEEKYKSFVRYWGIKEDNYNPRIAEFDFNELHRMYQNSEKFLQVTPCCRVLSWIVKNYDSIIAGKFSDRVATGKRSSG